MTVRTMADLMKGHQTAEIVCPNRGIIVRKLKVVGDQLEIDALAPPLIQVPLSTPIKYVPWFMDRGNLIFSCAAVPEAKLCTEADLIFWPDGTHEPIMPG